MEDARAAWRKHARTAAAAEGVPRQGLEGALAPADGVLASLAMEAGAQRPDRACLALLADEAHRAIATHLLAARFLHNAAVAGGEEADPELRAQVRRLLADLGRQVNLMP